MVLAQSSVDKPTRYLAGLFLEKIMSLFGNLPHNDLTAKISKLTDLISTLTNTVSTQGIKHENLLSDHRLLDERVTKNEQKLDKMQETTQSINTVSKIVQVVGIGAAGVIFTLWNTQASLIANTTGKTENNTHSIEQLRKESDEQERKIDENKAKIIANREAILSELKDAKIKGVPNE